MYISALAGTVWPALVGVAEVHPPKNVLPDARQSVVRNDDSDQVAVSLRISVAAGHKATEVLAVVAAAVRHFLDAQATGTTHQIVVKVVRFL
ncbi:MAG: hypothetical protein HIU81_05175 [Acidobacteria bacterium]|nr:hypothetical protein [Acidobacteriota bacterium]